MTLAASVLAACGFEPTRETPTCIRLRNCPYRPLSAEATELVCAINHRHLAGVLAGLQAPESVAAELAPRAGQCCVQLRAC
jgi:predicted ArsR family transcriptional regulator